MNQDKECLSKTIDFYKSFELNDRDIDLIIISHLHDDHVIGLEELLNGISVKTVILPYLTPLERLIVALMKINLPNWYYRFLSDPIVFLLERGVDRIVLIGGSEGEEGFTIPRWPEGEGPENKMSRLLLKKELPDDKELQEKIKENEADKWLDYLNTGKVLVKRHTGYVTVSGFWLFRFFNYKIEEKNVVQFNNCLRNKNINTTNNEKIRQVIENKKKRNELKGCYKELNKDLNNTSLMVYHGPIGGLHISTRFFTNLFFPTCPSLYYRYAFPMLASCYRSIGCLFTGDIDLNHKWNEIEKHFTPCFSNISIVQIPHHGSRKNWGKNPNLLSKISDFSLWIASAGISNRFGHPYIGVTEDIYRKGASFYWVNEYNSIIIEGEIEW
ncbi:MBL fold metallo-hydrolase [candidate division WOR-3 bacterium]|nr:MBL fold metallo-hydrolase [candidate division WOR-3 bacterium]